MKYNSYLFDLDGVLVNTDHIQYDTIKESVYELINYDISKNNDLDNIFRSTITTLDKLNILSNYIFLNQETIDIIYNRKKQLADSYFLKLNIDKEKVELMKYLKNIGCKIAVVTNSNKMSTNIILKNIGIYEFIDLIISNEDVINKKPNSECYLKAIEILNVDKKDCIIFEDSEVGITAAKNTGCDYYKVTFSDDINLDLIKSLSFCN